MKKRKVVNQTSQAVMTVALWGLVLALISLTAPAAEGLDLQHAGPTTAGTLHGPDSPGGVTPQEFGIVTENDLWIPAHDFKPLTSGVLQYDSAYYWVNTSATGNQFAATLELPQGAFIDGYRVFYFDGSAANNITVDLQKSRDDATSVTPPDFIVIGTTFQSIIATGYATSFVTLNHTVDLREGPGTTTRADAASFYTFIVTLPNDPTVRFKGLRVTWHRQISPAPAVATFSDVPTSHTFFTEIEALASSGITIGCGGGQYCPDLTVTRGQMAAFFSRALGLHWKPF